MLVWLLVVLTMTSILRTSWGFRFGMGAFGLGRRAVSMTKFAQSSVPAFRQELRSNHVAAGLDTVFALSSGPIAKSGVAVIRLSGPSSLYCLQQLGLQPGSSSETAVDPKPRMATLKSLYSPVTKDVLDRSLVLWFPGPRSFTGEDVVELHVHGSRAVIKGVFEALEHLDDPSSGRAIRPAAPGEFTRRAFDNGKMDLTEVEGLSDLLEAETSAQRKQALKQMDGHLRKQYEAWRDVLMSCLAHTEAVIDFGDDDREDDVSDAALHALQPRVRQLLAELRAHLQDGRRGELVREGILIALAGPPNAGKSSLMNALARRPAAIVSPIAGTTRDIVEVRLELAGVPCIVSDTAGLRENSNDVIELEGMRRAREAFDRAQIKLFVVDGSQVAAKQDGEELLHSLTTELNNDTSTALSSSASSNACSEYGGYDSANEESVADSVVSKMLLVYNKADLNSTSTTNKGATLADSTPTPTTSTLTASTPLTSTSNNTAIDAYHISCTTGAGLEALETAIAQSVHSLLNPDDAPDASGNTFGSGVTGAGSTMITRERHRRHVKICVHHLERFLSGRLPMDAAAEEIRLAMQELGKITGRVDVEELLDIIFRDFCIGK